MGFKGWLFDMVMIPITAKVIVFEMLFMAVIAGRFGVVVGGD